MVARERDGLPPYEPMPDGVEMMSYSAFYDSMFELADAECGRTGNTEALSHSFFLTHFFFLLATITKVVTALCYGVLLIF